MTHLRLPRVSSWPAHFGAVLFAFVACAGCVTTRPRAQVIIDVIAEPGVAAEARELYVDVRGGPSFDALEDKLEERLEPPFGFPVTLTIVPEADDTSRVFEVVVRATDRGGRIIGRRSMRGRFLPATTTYVQLVLEDCCRLVAPTCGADETCSDCACVPVVIVDPTEDAGMLIDAAQGDAGPETDANVDADLGMVDVGVDAGGCSESAPCAAMPCHTASCVGGACSYTPLCTGAQVCCEGLCADNCDCMRRRRGDECRAGIDVCDAPERCDGVSPVCPVDVVHAAGAVACGPAVDACDLTEQCDGVSLACPPNQFQPAGVTCAAGSCDGLGACTTCMPGAPCAPPGQPCATGMWSCSGTPACVVNGNAAATVVCRAAAGPCDEAEHCTGSSPACPDNAYRTSGVCRPSAGPCDVADSCNGSGAACPTDARASGSLPCRPVADECDRLETCDGSSVACPADTLAPAGMTCGVVGSDPDCTSSSMCTGLSATCPGASTEGQACRCNGTCSSGYCITACSGGYICCEASRECYHYTDGITCPLS